MDKQKIKSNKTLLMLLILLSISILIYFMMSLYFMKHFYFGTVVNSVNISGKSLKKANEKMENEFNNYTITLKERGDDEKINGVDIVLKYIPNNNLVELKRQQNPFLWMTMFFNKESINLDILTYDEKLLKESYDKLSCITNPNIINPENPKLKYVEGGYEVQEEIYGNKIKKENLYNSIVEAIKKGEKTLDLETNNCYENPKYVAYSKEVVDAKELLNKYIKAEITYIVGKESEELDGSIINNWINIKDNYEVEIDENKVKSYVKELSNTYDTYEAERDFLTSVGKTVKVSGGNYGWLIDTNKETKEIIWTIKQGEKVSREPIYAQTALSREENDIGDTYVEINMTRQQLWFYKNGKLLTTGDVVTGNINRSRSTPTGVFRLNYKQENATLQGENYSAPVKFWMPFYGNVGIHDATWRSSFGGNIYKTDGSHGCVNAPLYLAKTIYANIESGTPVICYYE